MNIYMTTPEAVRAIRSQLSIHAPHWDQWTATYEMAALCEQHLNEEGRAWFEIPGRSTPSGVPHVVEIDAGLFRSVEVPF